MTIVEPGVKSEGRPRSGKKTSDGAQAPRPPNCFNIYQKEHLRDALQQLQGVPGPKPETSRELFLSASRLVGQSWRTLTLQEQMVYRSKAFEARGGKHIEADATAKYNPKKNHGAVGDEENREPVRAQLTTPESSNAKENVPASEKPDFWEDFRSDSTFTTTTFQFQRTRMEVAPAAKAVVKEKPGALGETTRTAQEDWTGKTFPDNEMEIRLTSGLRNTTGPATSKTDLGKDLRPKIILWQLRPEPDHGGENSTPTAPAERLKKELFCDA
ncbi:hypothetical protein V5O48_015437 [Marasmius crinis-equi]|uniref:HMG box domain-containing protein n=1 Tax=Marasmius crinis-equi TaxID=585013 RepID=A0ABR3EUU9_9AGAR